MAVGLKRTITQIIIGEICVICGFFSYSIQYPLFSTIKNSKLKIHNLRKSS